MTEEGMSRRRGLTALLSAGPAAPGEAYGTPGTGSSTAISVVTSVALVFLWWLVTEMQWVKPLFLPSPVAVVERFMRAWTEEFSGATLWQHALWSLFRVFGAFFMACVTAIPVGIAMGVNRYFRGVFDPPIEFYRPIPPLGYLPLTVIWLGIGDLQKVALIYLAIFAPMAMNAQAGVRSVSIEQIHAAYSMGATRAQVVWHIILKGALPEILTGMRIGIGFGWTTLVAAEMVAAEAGLGFMVLSAAEFLVTEVVVLGIVVIGAIAYLFDLFMRWLERTLVPWKGKV
ncbi:MAG: ABC transporter permease subunit [Rhodospirillales bacterium]|nr:ABC transporter permease subunit [Rhodospirillales bacterium]